MTRARIINPQRLATPKGYVHGMLAPAGGRLLFIAGQVAWDQHEQIVSADFVEQFGQCLDNVLAVVEAAGGAPEHVMRMTIYVTDKTMYTAQTRAIGAVYRQRMARHFPTMSLVEVADLLEEGALVEIEATAVLPAERQGSPEPSEASPAREPS